MAFFYDFWTSFILSWHGPSIRFPIFSGSSAMSGDQHFFLPFLFFFTSFTHLCILHLVMLGGSGGWLSGMRRNPLHTWWEVLFWVIYIDFFSLLFISPFVRLTPSPDSEARSPHSVL